jgi:CubicO group peptidase (beta-lactamase class C family)
LSPSAAGWNTDTLRELLEFLEERNTTGFVVLKGGRLVVEQYWQGANLHTTGDVASVQKSLTAVLVGIAQAEGLLHVGEQVSKYLGEGWSRIPAASESKVTIRHLLTMTSGLTSSFEFETEPGTLWYYNTPAYHVLKAVLERTSGKDLNAYTREKVWDPIGDRDSTWRARPSGLLTGWAASPRDMARFGLLVLRRGAWAGTEVVPDKEYLAEALAPSQTLNRSYGYLWWLNGQEGFVLPGRGRSGSGQLIPTAPADVVAALGAADKKIYICPSLDLVVARHGGGAGEGQAEALSSFDSQLRQKLMAVVE